MLRQQETQEHAERREAVRALLMRPLLTPTTAEAREALRLVRRHSAYLREWFAREAGWPLRVERDYARLWKRPSDTSDPTRGWANFNRRRYAIFCLVCAVLARSEPQITLSALGDQILSLAKDTDLLNRGFILDMADIHDRRNLASACVALGELGVLNAIDGDAESFVKSGQSEDRSRDVLYDVNRGPLASILACVRGPSTWPENDEPRTTVDRISAITAEIQPETDEGRRDVSRHRISRRLLDDPVVYDGTVDEADMQYFINQRGAMANRLALGTGLVVELRSEGIALCDPDGNCSDVAMPADGTDAHVTLLVADHLAHAGGGVPDRLRIERFVAESAERYGRYWRRSAQGEAGARELTAIAIYRLSQLKLITIEGDRIGVLPALSRYKLGDPDIKNRDDNDRLPDVSEEADE
ncbi:hypothetical protein AS156_35870 [Bradyrhizobium macuxiense]|uniref:TIGR02678 family protein n=1 Tax=Bradyrhizobium macuxiense TaxID=1755647 RepID=A0A125Q9S8_9BRAD|nr:hypothetical protein AS156_35870 [Bradyrhizobium macuxiense]